MSNSDTKWSANGETIPEIEQHTKTKHLLTEQYVTDLIYTLHSTGRRGVTNFTIIDGFSGGGIYNDRESHSIWFGSPIRLINAVRKGYLKSERTYPLNVKFIFIDKKKEHLECLKNFVMSQAGLEQLSDEQPHTFKSEFGERIEQCEFITDEFENKVNYCIFQANNRKGHSLFFLDPFGWSDVSMESFRKINNLNKSEIIYTFMIDFIKRFIYDPKWQARDTFAKVLETDGYFDLNHFQTLDTFGEQAEFRNEFMRLFRSKGNAKKIITFAMMPKNNDRVLYYLFHICNHPRALEVMKDGSWKFNNLNYQYHYDIYGFGFKAALFYEDNQLDLKLDINQDSQTACINRLGKDLDEIIHNNPDGISFKDLCNKTMERNPATRQQYFEYLNLLREAKEIEVIRKGKKTNSKILENGDIIKTSPDPILFNMRGYISYNNF
ncbi:three-Cys-motif partner protein TcmP [Dolichospermum lemmermannii CS-548]|uniref:three-Cys-motif partner protein TcmP n=1 Tax=Dolichospermum lemmermannii TaxID=54295 RepID=UPI00232D2875|nr:three-Cys-motif partner protein TcmP [Dolichospermum lemmermannii]MDB9437359.1 three-Cys-motif partner protein TcmP [Dolichospermum lemmermannii CS-548]